MMVADDDIRAIALDIAKAQFGEDKVVGVEVMATFDSSDDEILQLTIALAEGAMDDAPDDAVLDTLVGIRRRLEAEGEHRRPTLRYDAPEDAGLEGSD